VWHAVDEHSAELDVLVQKQRNKAAKRFFRRVLRSNPLPRLARLTKKRVTLGDIRQTHAPGRADYFPAAVYTASLTIASAG
jgi:transposase-like protein